MSKKISELEKCEEINEQSSLPILHNGETMQLLYKTLVEDLKKILNFSDFSGNYEDLENKPEIPDVSEFKEEIKVVINERIDELIDGAPETLTEAIKKATQTSDVTLTASFKVKDEYCNLTYPDSVEVVGNNYDTITTENGTVKYRKGIDVQLKVKESCNGEDGKTNFDHWEVNGKVGYGQNRNSLLFTINSDTVITTVWSTDEVEQKPIMVMSTGSFDASQKRINLPRIDFEVPDEYEATEIGFQMSEVQNDNNLFDRITDTEFTKSKRSFIEWAYLTVTDYVNAGAVLTLKPFIIASGKRFYGSEIKFDFSVYKETERKEGEKAVYYSVKGEIVHTDYVASGEAPEIFYPFIGTFENEEFNGWIFNDKLYVGSVEANEFVYTTLGLKEYVTKQEVNALVKEYIDEYFKDIETIIDDINGVEV